MIDVDGCCLPTATIVTLLGERFACSAARATRSIKSRKWSVISVTLCRHPLAILSTSQPSHEGYGPVRKECHGRGRYCATARICRKEQRLGPALVLGCPAHHPRRRRREADQHASTEAQRSAQYGLRHHERQAAQGLRRVLGD